MLKVLSGKSDGKESKRRTLLKSQQKAGLQFNAKNSLSGTRR
jgi:hypothetical protein